MFCLVSLTTLGGAPRIDFPLSSLTSLTFSDFGSVIGSVISILTLEVGETSATLFNALEKVLQEESKRLYPRPVSSSLALGSPFQLSFYLKQLSIQFLGLLI